MSFGKGAGKGTAKGAAKGASKGAKGAGKGFFAAKGGSDTPSPALLTSYIKKAWTVDALLKTYCAHENQINHIHLSACWNSLGHLAKEGTWSDENTCALDSLVQHTVQVVTTSSQIRGRELANIAHGVAKSGRGGSAPTLMTALARSIERHLQDCNAQELANIAWAFAKAGQQDAELFSELARAADRLLDTFNAQELANTVWAFATVGHSDTSLFCSVARSAAKRIDDFSMQGLVNTTWAFARAGHSDASMFHAMARKIQQRVGELNTQDVAQTAWAYARAGQFDAALFTVLASYSEQNLSRFTAQGLANTVWAFAKAGYLSSDLFAAFAKATQSRLDEFNAQDMANSAWAFAKACHLDSQLFTALARYAKPCLDEFNIQDLVNTAWAFAKLGHMDTALFVAVSCSLVGRRLDELNAQQIANIAWAFAKAGQLDERLFTALARSAEERLADFSAQDLANVAWAFANAGQLDAQLFASLARLAEQLLCDFTDEELDNSEWAFERAGQHKIVKHLRGRRKHAASTSADAMVDVSMCGRIVVAGGGIGGAALAVALQRKGFDVVVLEADASFDARKQGYGLTIQRQDATQAMGINLAQDDAPSTSHYTFSAEGHILGFFGEAFGSKSKDRLESENSGRFIHIPRQMLRHRIVQQIRPGTIRWNCKLKSFACWSDDEQSDGSKNGVTVTLIDGSTLDAALLIGSDGIFSTVRRQLQLPGDRLNYVGLVVVLGIMQSPTALPLTDRRIFETVDGTTRIYAMPFTTSSTMWQLSFPMAEEAARLLVKDPAALKAEILRRCGKWHEPVPALLRNTPLDMMSGYPVYDRDLLEPDVLRTSKANPGTNNGALATTQRRVTLIGDAAHPMTPFKAQGANQALSDAVLFADTLVDCIKRHGPQQGFDEALPAFEHRMLNRSARMVVGSREKAKELHSKLALQPARKVQRENGVDMQEVIKTLRARGIGAHSAADPRGLDAVVASAIKDPNPMPVIPFAVRENALRRSVKRKDMKAAGAQQPMKARRQEMNEESSGVETADQASALTDSGFKWHRAIRKQLDEAAEKGVRRKRLRKVVLREYLGHLTKHNDVDSKRQWWEDHPLELKALFRKHLRQARTAGQLSTQGKMVCRAPTAE